MFETESGECAAFLVNKGATDTNVRFQNVTYELPLSSISILPDCKNVAFNTRRVRFILATCGKFFSNSFIFPHQFQSVNYT